MDIENANGDGGPALWFGRMRLGTAAQAVSALSSPFGAEDAGPLRWGSTQMLSLGEFESWMGKRGWRPMDFRSAGGGFMWRVAPHAGSEPRAPKESECEGVWLELMGWAARLEAAQIAAEMMSPSAPQQQPPRM